MLLWVAAAFAFGVAAGLTLKRYVRPAAAIVFVLGAAPMALLWARDRFFPADAESNAGIFVVLAALVLVPCAAGIFVASFFRD